MINYIINPYASFNTDIMPSSIMNSKKIKETIVENNDMKQYDGLILGTSSVLGINRDVLRQNSGINYFNYALFNSKSSGALAALKHFYSKNQNIKNILVGVDFFAYKDESNIQEPICTTKYLYKYSDTRCDSKSYFDIWKLHYQPSTFIVLFKTLNSFLKNKKPLVIIHDDGRREYIKIQNKIDKGTYDYLKVMKNSSNTISSYYLTYESFEKNIDYLRRITDFLQQKKIDYKLILPPLYIDYNTNLSKLFLYSRFYDNIKNKYSNNVIDLRNLITNKNMYNFVDARHPSEKYYNFIIENHLKKAMK